MDKETLGQKALNTRYKKVVDEQLKSDKTLQQKKTLYQKNTEAIDQSLNHKKTLFDTIIHEIESTFKKEQSVLLKTYKQQILALDKGLKEEKKRYSNDLKALDEALESKRSLNTLKEEKIENDFKMAKETFSKDNKKENTQIEKTYEKARASFDTKKTTLQEETKTKLDAIKKTHQDTRKRYDDALSHINQETKEKIKANEEATSSLETDFKKALNNAKKAYKEAIKPIEDAITALKKDYDKDVEELNTHYESEITKKQKYQKEKEKIADQQAASELAKEIKKLQKIQKEQLAHKLEKYNADLAPLNEKLEQTITQKKEELYKVKENHIDELVKLLKEKETIKQHELIKLNETNTKLLKEEAIYAHKKETITIDQKIQTINFNQTLEEAKLLYELESNLLNPKELLKIEQAKKSYNEQMNDLTKLKNYIKEVHKKDTKLLELKLALKTEQNAYELKRRHEVYQFDKEALKLRKNQELMEKDALKETFLVKHYYVHAKNYVALKNETMDAYKDSTILEINNRLDLMIKHYQALIKSAEKDHETMIAKIDATYNDEIKLYQDALNTLEESQKNVLSDLETKQNKDLEKDKAEIDRLHPKKDKILLKKYLKSYELKAARYQETLEAKSEEIQSKKALYTQMIEKIKSARIHSLEEAETLLIHIKDQLENEIATQKSLASKAITRFNNMQYEMRKSAELFDTFQRGREEDTLKLSDSYKQQRIKKEEDSYNALKEELNKNLSSLKEKFKAYEIDNNNQQVETTHTYQLALEHLETTKEENLKSIQDLYLQEKKRLDQTIKTITKNYEQAIKTLNQNTDKEKASCFADKEKADETLKSTIKEKDKAHEHYTAERKNLLNKDFERFDDASLHLLKLIKNDALTVLNEQDIPVVKAMITGEKAIEL